MMSEADKVKEGINSGHHNHPRVNVCAFTSIGNIYGGGYGTPAVMVGNPTVNINEIKITHTDTDTDFEGNEYDVKNDTNVPNFIDGATVKLWPHKDGEMGVIGNVYGGGNAAQVIGNTFVNIGTGDSRYNDETTAKIKFVSKPADAAKNVDGADIRGNVYGGGNNAEVTGNTNVQIGKKTE